MQDDTKQSLLAFKAVVDEQIHIAKEAKENKPIVLPQRIIQMFINRWNTISKALQVALTHTKSTETIYSTFLRKQMTKSARIEIPLLLQPLAWMMKIKGEANKQAQITT